MANYYPFKAHKTNKENKRVETLITIVDRKSGKVVFEGKNTIAASKFLGGHRLYIFHIKNGHRKPRKHIKYDLYFDGKLVEANNGILDKSLIVKKGFFTNMSFNNKSVRFEIMDIIYNKNKNYYDLWVKLNDLPPKYFYFSEINPPTFNNVINKIRDNIVF